MESIRLLVTQLPETRCLPAGKKMELLFNKEQDDTCGHAVTGQSDKGDSKRRTKHILIGFHHI
jgi:hypothetical protein